MQPSRPSDPAPKSQAVAAIAVAVLVGCALVAVAAAPVRRAVPPAEARAPGQEIPAAAGPVLYSDDLRTQRRWKEGADGACKTSYVAVGFVVEDIPPPGSCEFDLVQAGYFTGDVRIEVSVRLRRGNVNGTFGLKFGRVAVDNRLFHAFTVSSAGTFDLALNDGDWRSLIGRTPDPVVQQGYGALNRLAVEIRGGRAIRCFVNDKMVGSAISPRDVRGNIGLYLDEVGMEVVFTDLHVIDLAARAAPAVAGRVIFEDDLLTKRDWPEGTATPCRTFYADNGYGIEDVSPEGTCEFTLANIGSLPASVRIEVSAALRKGSPRSAFGLKFGKSSPDNRFFYTFTVNAEGAYRLSLWNGEWRSPIELTVDPVLSKGYGAAHRLAVEIRGHTIRCFINDKLVGSTVSPEDVRGETGLFVARAGMEVIFSKLRVLELTDR
jgi:hypothetical protein